MDKNIFSNLIITEVFSAMTIFTEENAKAKRINRPCWGIIIKYEGETVYTINGKKVVSNASNPVILPKGSSYEWKCVKAGYYSVIEFDCDLTSEEIFSFNIKNSDKIVRMFKSVEYDLTSKSPMYRMKSIKDTYSILLKLTENLVSHYITNEKKQKIQPAIDFIAKNYNKDIKNDTLAAQCNMSTVYFRKLFLEAIGEAPISYMHSLRMKKAREMLKSDYGSITDIALSLGYNNIYEFSKAFKKHTGVPPSKY